MNKKRMLSLILSFALVFTTVFAGAGSAFAATETQKADDNLKSAVLEVGKSGLRTKANTISYDPVVPKTMLYSTTSAPQYDAWDMTPNSYVTLSMTPKNTGLMYIDYKAIGVNDSYDDVVIYMIDSCEMTEEGLSYMYDTNYNWYVYPGESDTYWKGIPVKAGKTYKFLIVADESNDNPVQIQIRGRVFTTGQRTLSQGNSKWTLVSGTNQAGEYGKATWFKIKPNMTGLMTVNLKEYGYSSSYGTVQLYNANKKAVSNKVYHNQSSSRAKFGVKKGYTYYIKVTNCYGSSDYNDKYGIKYTVAAYKDRAIGTKSNAKKLVRKADATKTLFVASTSTSTDWYKFYVSSKRKTRININAADIKSGKLTVTFYKGSKKIDNPLTVSAGASGPIDLTYGTTYGKANSGWYYVKVVKSTKASGKYSIRYVQ